MFSLRRVIALPTLAVLVTTLFAPAAEAASFTFSATGSMGTARLWHSATLLRTGKVLVAGGGVAGEIGTAELYDPATGSWSTTGSLSKPRRNRKLTAIQSGERQLEHDRQYDSCTRRPHRDAPAE